MLSPRWLIGVTMFLAIAFVICNFIDGNPFLTSSQTNYVINMTQGQVISVTSSSGGLVTYFNIAMSTLSTILRALSWDYSFFYDIDPLTGLPANTEMALILLWFRLLFVAITVGVIFQMAYLLRQIITG